jgi:hypothetical protein
MFTELPLQLIQVETGLAELTAIIIVQQTTAPKCNPNGTDREEPFGYDDITGEPICAPQDGQPEPTTAFRIEGINVTVPKNMPAAPIRTANQKRLESLRQI